jgi:hypothetical protein
MKSVYTWTGEALGTAKQAMEQLAELAPNFSVDDVPLSMPLCKYIESALQFHVNSFTFVEHGGLGLDTLGKVHVDLVSKKIYAAEGSEGTILAFGGTVTSQKGLLCAHAMNVRSGSWVYPMYISGEQHKSLSSSLPISPWLARIVEPGSDELTTELLHQDVAVDLPTTDLGALLGKQPPAPPAGAKKKKKQVAEKTEMTFRVFYLKVLPASAASAGTARELTRIGLPGEIRRKGGRGGESNPFPEVDVKLLIGGAGFCAKGVESAPLEAQSQKSGVLVWSHTSPSAR